MYVCFSSEKQVFYNVKQAFLCLLLTGYTLYFIMKEKQVFSSVKQAFFMPASHCYIHTYILHTYIHTYIHIHKEDTYIHTYIHIHKEEWNGT